MLVLIPAHRISIDIDFRTYQGYMFLDINPREGLIYVSAVLRILAIFLGKP